MYINGFDDANNNGFEATRRLRRSPELKDVIIIGTSASVFDFDQQKSKDVGCNDFISKPIRISELLEKLQTSLALEWIYENAQKLVNSLQNSPEQTLVFPPAEEIAALLNLAMKGNLKEIMQRAAHLEQSNHQYVIFAQELQQLAKDFKVKKIREFLQNVES